MEGLDRPVLVLNRNYQPVRVTRVRRALMLVYVGAAQVLERDQAYDFHGWSRLRPTNGHDWIGTSSGPVRIPRLLLLARYGRVPGTTLRLTRRNIYLRDDYTCQYCARRLTTHELNLDHVTPRSLDGAATWENLVTSCRDCNFQKGSSTPEGAGMRLLRRPSRPSWTLAAALAAAPEHYEEWEPFLGAASPASAPEWM